MKKKKKRKKRKSCRVRWKRHGTSVLKKERELKQNSQSKPLKACWALKQKHCKKIPRWRPLRLPSANKTGCETETFDNRPILWVPLPALIVVYSFFRMKFLTLIQAKRCQREQLELQYASLVIKSFSMSRELFTVGCTWSIHWNEKSLKSFGVLLKCTATSQVFFLVTIADLWLRNLTNTKVI